MTGRVTVLNAADLGKLGTLQQPHHDLAVEWVDVGELTLFPGNARLGVVPKIVTSIKANGFFDPLTVQRSTGYIITGNHSYKAALDAGMKQVPVCYVDVDDVRALAMNLVHNKLGDDATYDVEALIDQLNTVSDEELEATGWTEEELAELMQEDPEEEPGEDDEMLGADGLGVVILAQNAVHQMQIIDDLNGQGYAASPTTVKNTVKLSNDY